MSSPEFPSQIITHEKYRTVTLSPEIEAALPKIKQAFAKIDESFSNDPENYLTKLQNSVFEFKSSEGARVTCSLLYDRNSEEDELLVIFAPFSDSAPKSSAKKLNKYITATVPVGFINKEKAAPNTWSQTTKSAVTFDLLGALGKNIPVLTIYSPIPSYAYSFKERSKIRKGDFSPAARIAKEAITEAQIELHGFRSETQIATAHLYGASLGASNAIGAGYGLHDMDFRVPTVTAQELIMGPENIADLGKRFALVQHVGRLSDETFSQANPTTIEEPHIRKKIDKYGSELIGTNARVLSGMKPTYMKGLTRHEMAVQAVEGLLESNVELLVALAENSALTYQTAGYLPDAGEKVVHLRGEKGQKIGHLVDEHVALSALVVALNITRSK